MCQEAKSSSFADKSSTLKKDLSKDHKNKPVGGVVGVVAIAITDKFYVAQAFIFFTFSIHVHSAQGQL